MPAENFKRALYLTKLLAKFKIDVRDRQASKSKFSEKVRL